MTAEAQHEQSHTEPWISIAMRERITLTLGCVIAGILTLWLARLLSIPATPGRGGILLQQPAWPVALLAACIALIACSLLTAIFASRVHYDAGLFCGAVGLAALSGRLGPLQFALFDAANGAGPAIYLLCAVELLIVFAAVAVAWAILRGCSKMRLLPVEQMAVDEVDESFDQKLLAMAAAVLIMILTMMLLCHSDRKPQTLASVAIAGYLAALGAHYFVPARPSIWYWSAPLIVGIVGYLTQYFSPSDWMIGDARGFFATLGRPMPLDYASLGVAGALLGYWTSLAWHHENLENELGA